MNNQVIWYEGYNNYKKCTLTYNDDNTLQRFHTEIQDVELMDTTNIFEIFNTHLSQRQTKYVEVCYSGGIDSELVILACQKNNIPVRAITMKIFTGDVLINTHDIYYSEKFCRENNIQQKFVELDIVKFYETGDYIEILRPYKIKGAQTALYLWLLSQCTGFTVMGGDYSWPWVISPMLSPHSHNYSMFDVYMRDKGIHGIGNMLSYSLDSNIKFIKSHLSVYNHDKHDPSNNFKLPYLKRDVFIDSGFSNITPRLKAYGLDMVHPRPYNNICKELFGDCISSISWNNTIENIIGKSTNYNEST